MAVGAARSVALAGVADTTGCVGVAALVVVLVGCRADVVGAGVVTVAVGVGSEDADDAVAVAVGEAEVACVAEGVGAGVVVDAAACGRVTPCSVVPSSTGT